MFCVENAERTIVTASLSMRGNSSPWSDTCSRSVLRMKTNDRVRTCTRMAKMLETRNEILRTGNEDKLKRCGLCALRHGIQISMEAIFACHPARSTEWLGCHPKPCELWRIRTGPISLSTASPAYSNVREQTRQLHLLLHWLPQGRRR